MSASVTAQGDPDRISAGTGTLTLAAGATLKTTNQILNIIADDIKFAAGTGLMTGTAACILTAYSTSTTIGLGSIPKDMSITSTEFGTFNVTGLTIGSDQNGSVTVNGISVLNSNEVHSTFTLLATRDDAQIVFSS